MAKKICLPWRVNLSFSRRKCDLVYNELYISNSLEIVAVDYTSASVSTHYSAEGNIYCDVKDQTHDFVNSVLSINDKSPTKLRSQISNCIKPPCFPLHLNEWIAPSIIMIIRYILYCVIASWELLTFYFFLVCYNFMILINPFIELPPFPRWCHANMPH